jgi:3-isopropylmalate/(R)-2-methylmalate dehydratase small subunit
MAIPTEFMGEVLKLGDDVNTDLIYPGKYILFYKPEEMRKHVFEGMGEDFTRRIGPGNILVAGENFGCGSSREQAAGAIQAAGVSVVIAKSFARIFFRNAINFGLLVLTCPDVVDAVEDGDRIMVDTCRGEIVIEEGHSFHFPALPGFLMEIVEEGGLVAHGKRIIAERKAVKGRRSR